MVEQDANQVIGVLGGMGPLASAEFLKTIYECSLGEREQQSPIVMMYSDPTFPDRTEMFGKGADAVLLERLTRALQRLREMGATKLVICCVTIHYLLPRLPQDLQNHVVSLVEVIVNGLKESGKRHILISSNGTRKLRIFQNHPLWRTVRDYVVLPDDDDQQEFHDLIYEVKKNRGLDEILRFLESRLLKYGVDAFVVGCTEAHLVAKRLLVGNGTGKRIGCLDPLMIIAKGSRNRTFCDQR